MTKKNEKKEDWNDLAERLKQFRTRYKGGITQKAFADELEIDQQRLSSYEMGTRVPHQVVASLMKLGAACDWLLFGEGPMFIEKEQVREIRELQLRLARDAGAGDANGKVEKGLSDFYVLPLYADEAAAGEPMEMRDTEIEGPAIIHRDWCPHPQETDYVRISRLGTSMEPTIPAGSIVTIDRSLTNPDLLAGKVVAIVKQGGGVTIKRLVRDERGMFVGQPDNPSEQNRPIRIEEGDRIVGKVTTVHAWIG